VDGDLRLRDGGEGQQDVTRAVVFDLFETLVDYDEEKSRAFSAAAAELLGREPAAFHALWREGRRARDSGPMLPYLESIGITGGAAERLLELRRANSAELLRAPRPGVVEMLGELDRRGIGRGLVTVCSEDVVDIWPDTPFAGLFDAEVFSCQCRLHKPDPRIYELALHLLGVDAAEALYVGDGTNDELAGAERAGMRAVQLGARDGWAGPRIRTPPEVLELV
jgi:putative hydrolase of the HAD superfamily